MFRKKLKKTATSKKKVKRAKKTAPIQAVDIKAIEANLPKKRPRSHHVLIKLKKVGHVFYQEGEKTVALKEINLNLYSGEFVIISGPSGSGKSTLLHVMLGLERPTKGEVYLRGTELYRELTPSDRRLYRRKRVGVVFQQSNWINSLSVVDNVAYPLWLAGWKRAEAKLRALKLLDQVGLSQWAKYLPTQLSGGQQQRAALARALATDPGIIMTDEPTGNLDTKAGSEIVSLLARLNREDRRMIVMITHDVSFLPIATRRIILKDGQIIYDQHD